MDNVEGSKPSDTLTSSSTYIQNNSAQGSIEMGQEPSVSLPLEKTDTNVSNKEMITTATSSKEAIYKCVLDTSIDSGIHDVVSKEESGAVEGKASTIDETLNTNAKGIVELSTVKEVKETTVMEAVKIQDNDDLDTDAPVKSVDSNKDMDVEEKSQASTENSDVVDETSGNIMMEYRTAEKVNAVDGSSDSSPDSSDSEVHNDDKTPGTNDTESQLNKIISNERDASPEREKRVKLNRHGFEDIRTKGELLPEDLPPLEELTITVDESVVMVEVGSIKSIVGILVVIQSNENVPALDDETILFVEGHKVLGQVFEVFGPVKTPWYSVRFNEVNTIEVKGIKVGMPVFCAPREDSFTKFVFVDGLKRVKGSDASWEDNNEPPEKHLDFSDDESERRAKAKRRNKKFGDNEAENGEGGENAQKKNPRQRNKIWPNRNNKSGFGQQQQAQYPKRGWNPFKGNQNENMNSGPPRYGGRYQDNHNNSHSNGQRWPHGQNNFRPQSRFGGPPNFQNRPRMGQNQAQPHYGGRNIQQQNNWRPPVNKNFTNMQNSGQHSFNGPPLNRPFNVQGTHPPMSTQGFGPSHCQNTLQAPMNVFSQPPPQFQQGNPVRPPNQLAGMNPWVGPQVGMPQQNAPFMTTKNPNQNNQSFSQGSQQQMNTGNQMYNQGQPVSCTTFQGNQSNFTQPGNASFQNSVGNFPNFGMNNGQNTFNQQLPNNFQQNQPNQFQTNSNFSGPTNFRSNDTGKGGLTGPNFAPAGQFTGMNPLSCDGQPSNTQEPKFTNFQIQNNPGQSGFNPVQSSENTNIVQNQNFMNNHQPGNVQSNSTHNQFGTPQGYGFQSNLVQNQSARQDGFHHGTNSSYSGTNLVPNGNNGFSQMSGTVQSDDITDGRFIQNN